jgi:hypothetical protein
MFVFNHKSLFLIQFGFQIVAQPRAAGFVEILLLRF